MARPGAKKSGAQPRKSAGGGKPWLAFVAGLALGVLAGVGVYLLKLLPTALELEARIAACDPTADPAKPATAAPRKADEGPVEFTFYNLLPEQKVSTPVTGKTTTQAPPVPSAVIAPTAPATEPAAATTPVSAPPPAAAVVTLPPAGTAPVQAVAPVGPRLLLQAGSFATRAEADRRRGELLLSGQSVSVQEANANGKTRFRVIVGPFPDEAALRKGQAQLAAMKVETLPLRVP